jgi:CRISPR system Cascade subunit CasC
MQRRFPMKVELHIIQNFPPSCLNRDDTNTPKDCEFGGERRARISSQCLKRAIRWNSMFQERLKGHLSVRSLRFPQQVYEALLQAGIQEDEARTVGKSLESIAKKEGETDEVRKGGTGSYELDILKTPQMVFYTDDEVAKCARQIKELLDQGMKVKEVLKRDKKKFVNLPKFPTPRSADIAMFGRMVTSEHFDNIDAACQVAHAISTNRVAMEMDFYTAVDDLQPEEETGAGMMGVVGYNSSCFYRYALVDVEQLEENLGGDRELTERSVEGFIRAAVAAIPKGKQTSMAAQNPPDAIFAVVRKDGAPASLANAFVKPVRPSRDKDLVTASIEAMASYWERLVGLYGQDGVVARPICQLRDAKLGTLSDGKVDRFEELVSEIMGAIRSR